MALLTPSHSGGKNRPMAAFVERTEDQIPVRYAG